MPNTTEASPHETSSVTLDDVRGRRFAELLLVMGETVDMYNTACLNDAPAEIWDDLDLDLLAQQHGALRVVKNGPKYWVMDSQTVLLGPPTSFGGLDARYGATVSVALLMAQGGAAPYQVFSPQKTHRMVYAAGHPVFELVDADGHAYVMQAHGPEFTLDTLETLGEQMTQLPDGWEYRTRMLTEALVLDLGPHAPIHAIGDEFHQYYTRIPGSGTA